MADKYLEARVKAIKLAGQSPLEYLASIYGSDTEDPARRLAAATAAAPYCHPKLKQVDVTLNVDDRRPEEIEHDITEAARELERRGIAAIPGREIQGVQRRTFTERDRRLVSVDGAVTS